MSHRATTYRAAKSLLILLMLIMAAAGSVFAQAQFRIPIYVNDNTPKRDPVYFGVHPQASYCIDNVTLKFGECDSIKEAELPPTPPVGVFDVRFIDVRSGPGACLGTGVPENITSYTSGSDVDTFQIKFQAGAGGYPFTFRWPQGLSVFADSIRLRDPIGLPPAFGGISVNMFTQDSARVTSNAIGALYIFVYHPKTQTYPLVPAPTAPANGATNVDTNATLTWSASTGSTGYILHISTSPTFATYVLKETLATTTKSLKLAGSGTFYWRVSAVHPFLNGCFSSVFSFQTVIIGPPVPVLVAPANLATGVALSPTLSWNASATATSYRVQVSPNASFTALAFDDSTITGTSVAVGPLLNCVTRFWRVRAKNSTGSSDWATARSFTTILAAPGTPAPVSPADNAASQPTTLTLSWTGADSCSKTYRLEVAKDSLFGAALVFDNLATSSRSVGPLEELTKYFWRVRAKNQGTDTGSYSALRRFTTLLNPPAAPSILSPANADTTVPPAATLRWQSSTHVDSYQVQVATDAAFASIVSDQETVDTVVVTSPLENCRTYYWRVRGRNASGAGPYASRNFRVVRAISSSPTLLLPANGAVNVDENTTLSWQAEQCAFQYRVELAKDSLFTQIVTDQVVGGLTIAVGPLDGNTLHYWRVRGVNNLGQGSPSAYFRFRTTALTTPPPPVLLSPANGATGLPLPVTLTWDSAARATLYRLQVAVDSNFTTMTYNDTTSGASRSKTFTFLLNSTTYYWRVSSANAAGTSGYSAVSRFTTLSPPSAPTLIIPVNNAEGVTSAPVFAWSVPQNAQSYRLQVARDSIFTSIYSDDSNIVNTSWQTGPLQSHTRYYWRVRAKNSVGTGAWSVAFTFRTTFIGVANWLMPIAIRETGMARDTLYLGLHPDATCGLDPWLGEFELPPPPYPGTFDARFISTASAACNLGEGTRVNLLKFVTYTQVDTYRVHFQPGTGSYPIVLSWDPGFISTVCDSMVAKDEFGGSSVYARMDRSGSVSVANSSITSLLLLKYGAFPLINDVRAPAPSTPTGYMLSQNYPNPFNPTTRITFSSQTESRIRVTVYDLLGREVSVLADENYAPGVYSVEWDGRNASGSAVPSGAYYLRMTAMPFDPESGSRGGYSETRKMLLLK
jgi:hypothetical protein